MDSIKVHPLQQGEVDEGHLNRLYQHAISLGPPGGDPEFASSWQIGLSLEEFFEGNNCDETIACNLASNHPGISVFRDVLESIRAHYEVLDVQIRLGDFESDPNGTLWPHADTIYIYTKAMKSDIIKWLDPLRPDEQTLARFLGGKPRNAPKRRLFYLAWAAWWD